MSDLVKYMTDEVLQEYLEEQLKEFDILKNALHPKMGVFAEALLRHDLPIIERNIERARLEIEKRKAQCNRR